MVSEANVFKAGSDQAEDFRCVASPLCFSFPCHPSSVVCSWPSSSHWVINLGCELLVENTGRDGFGIRESDVLLKDL